MYSQFNTYADTYGTITKDKKVYALTHDPYLTEDGIHYEAIAVTQNQIHLMTPFNPEINSHFVVTWAGSILSEPINVVPVNMGESRLATTIREEYNNLESSHNELFNYFKDKVAEYNIDQHILNNTFLLHKWNIQLEYFPFSKSEIYNDMCMFTDDEIIERLTDHIVVINNTIDAYALEHNHDIHTLYELEGLVILKNKIKNHITTYSS